DASMPPGADSLRGGDSADDGGDLSDPPPPSAAAQRPALLLGEASPHAGGLASAHGPLEALEADLTAAAHCLRGVDLGGGGSRRADGKEKLRILVLAQRAMHPVHLGLPPVGMADGVRLPGPAHRSDLP